MYFIKSILATLTALCLHVTSACYQDCSAAFNQKIKQLVNIRDQATLTLKSCQAMSEQMVCLEGRRSSCDPQSLQYVINILNFIRPDYERTCASSLAANQNGTTSVQTPTGQALQQCNTRVATCFNTFNATYSTAVGPTLQSTKNITALCQALDNYTVCLEDLMPECGQFMGRAIQGIRAMQMRYSYVCSARMANKNGRLSLQALFGSSSPQAMTECVNDTMDCYSRFNATFLPAVNSYKLADMCSSMDTYSQCLNTVHQRTDCQRYTQQALAGVFTLKRQYSVYCGTDGGQQTEKCVSDFQQCYSQFNSTYFPALHAGNMDGICSSVANYSDCVQPMFSNCGRHMAQSLSSVRILKEQFSLQCNPEYQRLMSCKPLQSCLQQFGSGFVPAPGSRGSSNLCRSLSSYFPCVEQSLQECKIPPEDTSVDFSQLGTLTSRYCQNLLGNRVLNMCPEFVTCASGIVLVSAPDPSAMFDGSTWCSYMDMSLSCVDRAVNTPHCGLTNDDTIKGHLTQQRELKRNICKLSSVSDLPNVVNPDNTVGTKSEGKAAGQEGSGATTTLSGVISLVMAAVISLVM